MTALAPHLIKRLRCPACGNGLTRGETQFDCADRSCGARFPFVDGVLILINEETSVFSIEQFTRGESTYFEHEEPSWWRQTLGSLLIENSLDLKTPRIRAAFFRALASMGGAPEVLILGSGQDVGELVEADPSRAVGWTLTDVSLSNRLALVCDAHDIPFVADTFDGVVVEAVLEHVANPYRCVDEIHRVLKPGGIVLSDTPFMQQVHGGRYDFTRFTPIGHRRLFRRFEEVESGVSSGPGVALTWSYRHFLLSFVRGRSTQRLVRIVAKLTSFWWKYFDYFLIDRAEASGSASATYFIGRKSESILGDRALVQEWKGADPGDVS